MKRIVFYMLDSVPKDQIDRGFIQGMINRMCVGYFNYGPMRRYDVRPNSLKNARIRLRTYEKTRNTEYLMDASNYCMMEFCVPSLSKTYFKETSKMESPGAIVEGRLVKGKEDYTPAQLRRLEELENRRKGKHDRRVDHGE